MLNTCSLQRCPFSFVMKIKLISFLAVVVVLTGSVDAIPVTLSQYEAFYVGRVEKGTPSSSPDQASYVNYLIGMSAEAAQVLDAVGDNDFDRLGSTYSGSFDPAAEIGGVKQDNGNTFFASGSFQFIYGKYGGHALVWYSADGFLDAKGNDMGVILPEKTVNSKGKESGLSHTSGYNRVPDGGFTLALLGLSLLAIGGAKNFFQKKKA